MSATKDTYGLLAEFADGVELVEAARRARGHGFHHLEAYSPLPVEGLAEAVGFPRTKLPLLVLCGGILGCLGGYALQVYCTAIAYPLNIGGRPLNSWPAFVPVMFETTVLGAALTAVLGMLALNGLPRPHHPLFAIPEFDRASQDRFFLFIRNTDPMFDSQQTRDFLTQVGATEVFDVPA